MMAAAPEGVVAGRRIVDVSPPKLAMVAGAVGALTVAAYQSWFMPFFQPFFAGRDWLARPVFYALYGSVLVIAAIVFASRRDVRRKILPYAIVAVIALAAVALHPIGLVTRAYIISMILGGATVVLMLGSAPVGLLRLSASVTVLNAMICLLDIFFTEGFTNSAGRAGGLAINPNVAAASLLLGAAASYRVVPGRFRLTFFVLVGTALAVTMSRSTILAAVITVGITFVVDAYWRGGRKGGIFRVDWTGLRLAAATLAVLLVWIGFAFTTNERFHVALDASTGGLQSAETAIDEAQDAVASSVEAALPVATAVQPPAEEDGADAAKIEAISKRVEGEGGRNTISARALFLERAMLAYKSNGFFGMGLEAAHPLVPHNTFVLFALAFGHLGWLIPLAVVGVLFYSIRDPRDLPLGLAAIGTMLTSHDILLTPSLFLPIALGIGGMLAGKEDTRAAVGAYRGLAYGAVGGTALFLAGCFAILSFSPSFTVEQLRPEAMRNYRGAYAASLNPPEFSGIFRLEASEDSYLHEGAVPLSPVDWSPASTPAVGTGQYVLRRRDLVLFAASDGSDPRQNGRSYQAGLSVTVNPLFFLMVGAILIWCSAVAMTLVRGAPRAREA